MIFRETATRFSGSCSKELTLYRMWKRLSLRARLFLPMVAMTLLALGLGGVALQIVSPDQFEYENAEQSQSTKAVADALNAALAASNNPRQALDAFEHNLG